MKQLGHAQSEDRTTVKVTKPPYTYQEATNPYDKKYAKKALPSYTFVLAVPVPKVATSPKSPSSEMVAHANVFTQLEDNYVLTGSPDDDDFPTTSRDCLFL